ncbi:MAG: HAD family hydrolase [Rhodanobacter sp.]
MPYELLICDFDGTLANTRHAVLMCMQETLRELLGAEGEIEAPDIERVVATGATLPKTFDALFSMLGASSPERIDTAIQDYRARYAQDSSRWTTLYPGVRGCLDFAQANGMCVAVVSNKGESALQAALGSLDIVQYFDLVLGEQADLPPKPAPDVFDRRIRAGFSTIDTKAMLFVGDTPADLEFAKNAGIDSCWAVYGHGTRAACQAFQPRFEINNFHELQVLLEQA